MREKEKKRMWPQSSLAAIGSFTLQVGVLVRGRVEGPLHPDPHLALQPCQLASA